MPKPTANSMIQQTTIIKLLPDIIVSKKSERACSTRASIMFFILFSPLIKGLIKTRVVIMVAELATQVGTSWIFNSKDFRHIRGKTGSNGCQLSYKC